jgi:hypothetical protein
VRSAEIISAADRRTREVDDLMGLATQKFTHKARHAFKPSPLGLAVTFAFPRGI